MVWLELVLHTVAVVTSSFFSNWEQVAFPSCLAVAKPQERKTKTRHVNKRRRDWSAGRVTLTSTTVTPETHNLIHIQTCRCLLCRRGSARAGWGILRSGSSTPPPGCEPREQTHCSLCSGLDCLVYSRRRIMMYNDDNDGEDPFGSIYLFVCLNLASPHWRKASGLFNLDPINQSVWIQRTDVDHFLRGLQY